MKIIGLLVLLLIVGFVGWGIIGRRLGPDPPVPPNLDSIDPQVSKLIDSWVQKVKNNKRSNATRINLGKVYEANTLHDLAADTYRQVLDSNDRIAKVWFRYAVCLEREGDLQQAVEAMEHAIELNPEFAASRWRQSMWLLDIGEIDKAAIRADEAIQLNPEDTAAYFAKVRVHLARRENQQAIDLIQDRQLQSDSNGRFATYLMGTAYRQMGETEKAVPFLQAESFRPHWRDEWSMELAKYHTGVTRMLAEASGYLRKGRCDIAIPILEKAVQQKSDDPRVFNMLGACYLNQKDHRKALAAFRQALNVNENDFSSNLNYAAGLIQAFRFETVDLNEGIRYADKAISLRPQSAKPHAVRAQLCLLADRSQDAIESFAKSYELDSRSPEYAVRAAMLELDAGQLAEAKQRLEPLLKGTVEDAMVYIGGANIRIKENKFAEAEAPLRQGLLAPRCAPAQREAIQQRISALERQKAQQSAAP